jgi:superfamily II DNA or RNA helicase
MTNPFRAYQEEAYTAIISEISVNPKCLVKMFCGSGKSLLMSNVVSHLNNDLSVFVFPSLSLVDQFYTDYLYKNKQNVLRISSDANSTTNPKKIMIFLNKNIKKIICTTYQSLKILLNNLKGHKIGVCCFDEAHHSVGKTYQKYIFDSKYIKKQIFFTATPNNANGIVMQVPVITVTETGEPEPDMEGNCGKLTYDYSYKRGVEEGYLNKFEVKYDILCSETKTNRIIYESIARAILTTGNNRVLTFHSKISKLDSSVYNFTNEKKFIDAFRYIIKTEFPDKNHLYTSIKMIGLDAKIKQKKRRETLNLLDTCVENEIVVICSCRTIGEGIDTKNANMCVFVDPKSSLVEILQNIGRVVRKQIDVDKPASTVLIPYWLDDTSDEYTEYKGYEDEDSTIRDEKIITKNIKYKGILEVVNKLIQGNDIVVNKKDKINKVNKDEKIACAWNEILVSVKEFIHNKIKLSDTQCDTQLDIIQLSSWISKQNKNYINKTKEMEREEIYILWTNFLEEYKEQLYLFDYKWNDKLESLKMFIDSNTKLPCSKQSEVEAKLYSWYLRQRLEYKKIIGGMKKEERFNQWTLLLENEKYKQYFKT